MQSSDQYNERVSVALARSRLAEGFVAAAALSTLFLVWAIPLASEAQACAIAWIGGFSWIALRRLRSPLRIELDASGAASIDGIDGALRDRAFVAPWLTVLRWRPVGAWFDRTVLIAPDRLPAEDFRRLRVLLKFGDRPLSPLRTQEKRTWGTDHNPPTD